MRQALRTPNANDFYLRRKRSHPRRFHIVCGRGGPRSLRLPKLAPGEIFEEYAAERRTGKGWEKKPGIQRNEALDLSVYALALAIMLGAERIREDALPAWARSDRQNCFAVDPADAVAVNNTDLTPDPEPSSNPAGFIICRPVRRNF